MSFLNELQNPEYFTGVTASTGSRDFMTPGFHKATITKAEEVANKDKPIETHASLVVTFTGLDGDAKGIEIVARFNIRNPNQQAVDIGKSQFLALLNALGMGVPKASLNELFGKPVWLKVKNGLPNDKGRVYPEVAFHYPLSFVPPFVGTEPGYVPPAITAPAATPVAKAAPAAAYGANAASAAAYGADDDIPF